jgi:hypothetical protein
MRNLIKILIVLILTINSQTLISQESKTWEYPIRPGTVEWTNLKTYEERLNAYNIPNRILYDMKTKDLVETCLNYPEFRLLMTRNSLQQGYDYLKTIFNGFAELEKRSDAGKELLIIYKKLNPSNIKKYNTLEAQGKFAFEITYIEILLAQGEVLDNVYSLEKKELIKKSIENYEVIENMPVEYATFGLITPALILGRILENSNYSNFINLKNKDIKYKSFIDYTNLTDTSVLSDIILISKEYLIQIEHE